MNLTVTRGASAEYQDERGNRYWSVSEHITLLDPLAFSGVPPHVLAAAGMRGEKLHIYFALMLASLSGAAEWPERPQGVLAPQFDSIARWVEARKPKVIHIETASINQTMHMAGRPDAEVWLDDERAIIDLKNGVPRAVHAVQLHGYHKLEGYGEAKRLFSLYSQKNGSIAKLEEHTHQHTDWAGFVAANAVLRWRRHRGI